MKQKISMLLCVVLLLGSLLVVGSAEEMIPSASLTQKSIDGAVWYEIASSEDFYAIATVGTDKNYALTSDTVSLRTEEGYTPIADFAGKLVGCNKAAFDAGILQEEMRTITLELSGTADKLGVFGSAGTGFSIRNLHLNGTVSNTQTYTGSLFGIIACAGELKNCVNDCKINGKNYTGGLVGSYAAISTVTVNFENVVNHGDISGGTGVGGIMGNMSRGSVSNAANYGSVTGNQAVGGIFGNCRHTITVEKAFNAGTIQATGTDSSKNPGAGGIIGGLKLGWSNHVVLTLQNAFNTASVTNGAGTAYAGALIGNQANAENLTITNTISNCYNAVQGTALFGTEVDGSKTNIYYISDITDLPSGGLTESEMKKAESFNGFDFETVWEMNAAGSDYPYPQLKENTYIYTVSWGTEEHPYEIDSSQKFQEMISAHGTEGVYFKLTQDIALPDTYTPLPFSGNFDGNGKTITVDMTLPDQDNVGLFSELSGKTVIENLTVDGTISARGNVGGFAGITNTSTLDSASVIRNCVNRANITGTKNYIGGIIGNSPLTGSCTITVSNCENHGNITAAIFAGGIAGLLSRAENCRNFGKVESVTSAAGGIAGNIRQCVTSYNKGEIRSNTNSAGGIAGYPSSGSGVLLRDCYNTGDIYLNSAEDNRIGGIVGEIKSLTNSTIQNCYTVGNLYKNNTLVSNAAFPSNYAAELKTAANIYFLSSAEGGITLAQMRAMTSAELSDSFAVSEDGAYPFPVLRSNPNQGGVTIHTVNLSADTANGRITPSGTLYLKDGDRLKIELMPDENYMLSQFLIDGTDLKALVSKEGIYTTLVQNDMVISAEFVLDEREPVVSSPLEAFSANISAVSLSGKLSETELQAVIGKPVLLAFAATSGSNAAYTLIDYGMVISKTDVMPEMNKAGCVTASIKDHFDVFRTQYGILFYGDGFIEDGTVYYIRPYAVYQKGSETVVIYGENVMTANPFSITEGSAE